MPNNNSEYISEFWGLFKSLNPDEADNFLLYAGCPLFNRKKPALRILKICKAQIAGKKANYSKKEIYALAFEGKKYNEQVLKNYFSYLKKLLLTYLQIEWLQQKQTIQSWATTEMLLNKGLVHVYEKLQKRNASNTGAVFSNDAMYAQFRLQLFADEYFSTTATKRKFHMLESCVLNLREYYFLDTMRMYCELINRKNLRSTAYDPKQLHQFLAYYNACTEGEKIHPLLQLYYQVFMFLQDSDDEKAYHKYKELLTQNLSKMPVKTARELCLYGQNQCVRHINLSHQKYLTELFDLYNLMLQHNLMYEGQYMSQWTYKNYITVALRLKEFTQAEHFIEKYKEKILPDVRNDAYHYNLASMYFEKNEYSLAMDALTKVHFNDAIYYLDSRSILLKIYFAGNDFEALASLYHSVRVYLLRNRKLGKKQADLYKYLFLYTYRLSRLQGKKAYVKQADYETAITRLALKVQETDIANKSWLLTKFAQAK